MHTMYCSDLSSSEISRIGQGWPYVFQQDTASFKYDRGAAVQGISQFS